MTKEDIQKKISQLQQKSQTNLQKFIGQAFDMVNDANDIQERILDLQKLPEYLKQEEVKPIEPK